MTARHAGRYGAIARFCRSTDPVRPLGYPLFLWILGRVHHLAVVPTVQHVMGLAMAVLIYALLVRLRVPRWAAALAAAPVLLDAYQLEIEHYVLAETLFEALIVAAIEHSTVPLPSEGNGKLIILSTASKRRPGRQSTK